ncbi:MAG TPA: HAD family hydrolase, partial [Lachnoclostridium sp.]|nr:HAD family hydrolase [Lachnoclostridium sp.]
GILAGKRAGMTVCAIDDEFSREMEEEKRQLADYFIYDYHQILKRKVEIS